MPVITNQADTWLFAYGSNLSVDQKVERTGPIREAIRCRLPGYRFAFNKRRAKGPIYSNIVPDENSEVWGVVYRCNAEAMAEMDRREGVARGDYSRQPVVVITDSGEKISAEAYIAGPDFICPEGILKKSSPAPVTIIFPKITSSELRISPGHQIPKGFHNKAGGRALQSPSRAPPERWKIGHYREAVT